ncbi:Tat pathway signal sequence domain protein [Streptomyces corchorusii]|uniref:Tat pathway signal sequence domain protein n=1 Tax=Streptomyces corchorusii TaxID=1903 RepID=A0A101QMI7_STRCK|nr:Tat pathway signal sequence domain protein [Streptomyces corchorusii]
MGLLRRELGELIVPLGALAGVSFEQGRKSGRLRLRLRAGADPLLHATGGRLAEPHDPYRLAVEPDRYGVAEYVADEVRNALLLDGVPPEPVDGYLLPGPSVPVSASAGDGTAGFDGERVRLEWNWKTEEAKAAAGPRTIPLADITGVEWQPAAGLENGHLRFLVRGAPVTAPPKYDPNAVELWGFKRDPLMALVAAAVQARLPHPSAAEPDVRQDAPPPAGEPAGDDHDVPLRRLRELGELHRDGVLTDEEFAVAKRAVLKRL